MTRGSGGLNESIPGCTIEVQPAAEVRAEDWLQLQVVELDAFTDGLVAPGYRTQEEVHTLVGWSDDTITDVRELAGYVADRRDLNRLVDGSRNPNQLYFGPRVAIAREDGSDRPVGMAYAVGNVSGPSCLRRLIKRFVETDHSYVALDRVVVHPEYQRNGLATALGYAVLSSVRNQQRPVTTYVWPEHGGRVEQLQTAGFTVTGMQESSVFGEDRDPVLVARMQASSVKDVLAAIDRRRRSVAE